MKSDSSNWRPNPARGLIPSGLALLLPWLRGGMGGNGEQLSAPQQFLTPPPVLACSQTPSPGRCCIHVAREGGLQTGIWAPGAQNKVWTTLWIKSFFLARKSLRRVNILKLVLHSHGFESPN